MKIVGRILVILVAALAVVGATVAVRNMSSANTDLRQNRFANSGEIRRNAEPGAGSNLQDGPGQRRRGDGEFRRDRQLGSVGRLLFGLVGLVQNLVIIGVIVLVVVGVQRWLAPPSPKVQKASESAVALRR